MVMDTLAGVAFSFEPPIEEYMDEYPHKKDEAIINKYMLNEILYTGLYSSFICIVFLKLPIIMQLFRYDINDKYLYTAFFGLFIFIDVFNSFNARTSRINILANILKNKVFIYIILFIVLFQVFLIYYGGNLFRTSGLTFLEFEIMILFALSVIPFDWIRKYVLKRKSNVMGVWQQYQEMLEYISGDDMKKIVILLVLLLCIGCGKSEKNVTINIYTDNVASITNTRNYRVGVLVKH